MYKIGVISRISINSKIDIMNIISVVGGKTMFEFIKLGVDFIPYICRNGIIYINLDYPWDDELFIV